MKVFQKAVQILAVIGACHSLFTMELGGCVFYGILLCLFAFLSDEKTK